MRQDFQYLLDVFPDLLKLAKENLPTDRFHHSVDTALNMMEILRDSEIENYNQLVGAALIHDIGYAFPKTKMHAVDGGIFLNEIGLTEYSSLVAWHSTAEYECEILGVKEIYDFSKPDDISRGLIWHSDFTSSPKGQKVSIEERISDIETRYRNFHNYTPIKALQNSAEEFKSLMEKLKLAGFDV